MSVNQSRNLSIIDDAEYQAAAAAGREKFYGAVDVTVTVKSVTKITGATGEGFALPGYPGVFMTEKPRVGDEVTLTKFQVGDVVTASTGEKLKVIRPFFRFVGVTSLSEEADAMEAMIRKRIAAETGDERVALAKAELAAKADMVRLSVKRAEKELEGA